MDVDVLDKSINFFSWCYLSHDLFIFDRNHFCKNGMAAILNFKFTQKRIIKNILAFRLHRITIFISKFTFSGSVTANVPLKMTPDGFNHTKQKSPAVAREDVLQPIQLLLQYWPSRSSKVYEFHLIWKSLSHFLLVINSNLGSILYLWPSDSIRCWSEVILSVAVQGRLISQSAKSADLRSCFAGAYWDRTDTHGWLPGWCLPGLLSGRVRWVPSLFLSCLGVGWRVGETLAALRDNGLD